MSDDSDQEYVYSEDEDDYNDDEDAEMSDADAPAAPRARKSGSTGSKDDGAPSRLGDGAYALMEPADVERMLVAKAREVSETLDARPGAPTPFFQPPPLPQTRIEKNQGCNHMNCSQCKYEFCWMCMGDWADHGATTGGFYKCNKYDPLKAEADDGAMDDQARAKRELDRYLHYYKRFHGHDQSQAFATKQLESTEKRMVELQESTHGSWIDVQFLKTANEMRELFENLQEHLERFTETLSEMTELPLDQMDRSEIVNVTRVTESFLANLIQGAEAGLDVPDDDAAPAAAAAA
ncbi:hypothetical protein JL720_14533 [Aureococcus anophagefferens]|nr:hypothetical protein JL720_14533 [Aureococcus anophagefferens]